MLSDGCSDVGVVTVAGGDADVVDVERAGGDVLLSQAETAAAGHGRRVPAEQG